MKWMLIVVVFNLAPVKTDLVFNTLNDCLKTEENMRAQWVGVMNAVAKQHGGLDKWQTQAPKQYEMIMGQANVLGTCIPSASK